MDTYYTTNHVYYTQVRDGAIIGYLQGPIGGAEDYLRQNAVVGPVPADVSGPRGFVLT